jgi:hypothetical protein
MNIRTEHAASVFRVEVCGLWRVACAICIGMPLVTGRHGSCGTCRYKFGSFMVRLKDFELFTSTGTVKTSRQIFSLRLC